MHDGLILALLLLLTALICLIEAYLEDLTEHVVPAVPAFGAALDELAAGNAFVEGGGEDDCRV